jgi:4-oxalocrotonate tautomerase
LKRGPASWKGEIEHAPRHRQALARKNGTAESASADKIAKDVIDVFSYGEESVSVGFEEIKSQDWKDKVYKPDIQDKWERLYKKPGYEV